MVSKKTLPRQITDNSYNSNVEISYINRKYVLFKKSVGKPFSLLRYFMEII